MPKRIDEEVKARAVRLVTEHQEYPSLTAAAEAVAKQVGVDKESVRRWVIQKSGGEPDAVKVAGPTPTPTAGRGPGLTSPGPEALGSRSQRVSADRRLEAASRSSFRASMADSATQSTKKHSRLNTT